MTNVWPAIKSPLNYTGNKYRILPQIMPFFPQEIGTMVDLFCGGATVGINVPCNSRILIDSNSYVIELLKYLSKCNFERLLLQLESMIKHYKLSYSARDSYAYYMALQKNLNRNNGLKEYNSQGFYEMREDYNALIDKTTAAANVLLYLLIVYGFNNDIRFSKDGRYNLPVGKTDLNKNNINKLREYIARTKEIQTKFVCGDFRAQFVQNLIKKADFVYMDPPYLITDAVYNESGQWGRESEAKLVEMMDLFVRERKKFVLSNVLEKKNSRNDLLAKWLDYHVGDVKVVDIDYHYRGASYNKINRDAKEREIIVVPTYM